MGEIRLTKKFTTSYNSQKIKWFVGDVNFDYAVKIGCGEWKVEGKSKSGRLTNLDGFFWEAWGSCNGHGYQLFAWCSRRKKRWWQFWIKPYHGEVFYLKDIKVCIKEGKPYFDKQTYNLLTQSLPINTITNG